MHRKSPKAHTCISQARNDNLPVRDRRRKLAQGQQCLRRTHHAAQTVGEYCIARCPPPKTAAIIRIAAQTSLHRTTRHLAAIADHRCNSAAQYARNCFGALTQDLGVRCRQLTFQVKYVCLGCLISPKSLSLTRAPFTMMDCHCACEPVQNAAGNTVGSAGGNPCQNVIPTRGTSNGQPPVSAARSTAHLHRGGAVATTTTLAEITDPKLQVHE